MVVSRHLTLLVPLLTLLGVSVQGLQKGLQYQYHYEGWAGTGINDLSSKGAVSAIRADLFIQILETNESKWQIQNVEYAEQNGYEGFMDYKKTGCEEELQWQPLIDYKEAMETPFLVTLDAHSKSGYLQAAQNEPLWVTNIRRSLLHLFRIPVLEVNWDLNKNIFEREPFISQFEQSPQGECLTWYSLIPIMDAHKMELSNDILGNIEGDVQLDTAQGDSIIIKGGSKGHKGSKSGRKGSKGAKGARGAKGSKGSKAHPEKLVLDGPTIDDSMWRLTRTIDFDQCRDLAQYHTVGDPTTGSQDNDDCHNVEPLQRSHTGEFFLRGGPNGIRLERAQVKGVYTVDAVGNEAGHLHTFTNQRLDLRSIRQIETEINTGEQEYVNVDLRYFATNPIQHIIGDQSVTYIKIFKDFVMKLVRSLAEDIETSRHLNVADDLEMISQSEILGYLMQNEDFQDIYNALKGDDSPTGQIAMSLYFKVLSASGQYNPVMYLIETIKNDESFPGNYEMTPKTMAVMYLIMNFNAIEDTRLVSHLWNATRDNQLAELPFSLLAKRLCMNPCNQENTRDSTCLMKSCRSVILKEFLPAMVNVINNPDSDETAKHQAIQALKNLHTAAILDPLKPIVLGTSEKNILLRMHSIFAIKGDNLPRAPREEIFNLLNGVFENHHEHPLVREAALRMLPHWTPPAAWWYHIAISSWQEPNRQIAAVIYNIITTFAPVYPAANRAALITKPAPPSSLFYSNILFTKNGGKNDMFRSELLWTLMGSNEGLLPALTVLKLQGGFLNFNFNELQITSMNAGGTPWKFLFSSLGEKDASADIVKDMYNEVLENLGVEIEPEDPYSFVTNYLLVDFFKSEMMGPIREMLNNDNLKLPRNHDIMQFLLGTFGASMVKTSNAFVNTGRYTHTIFTEIGVPLTIQHSQPTFLSLTSLAGAPDFISPLTSSDDKKATILLEIILRMDHQQSVHMRTIMPWSKHELVGGLKARQELTFPFDVLINIDKTDILQVDLTFNINNKDNSGNLLGVSNTPFTAVAPIMHSSSYQSIDNYRVIRQSKGYKENLDLLEYTGLTLTSTFEGDVPYFFRKNSWNSLIANIFNGDRTPIMQPTARFYEWNFGINLSKTKVQSFSFTFNYLKSEQSSSEFSDEFSQYGQGKVDYSEYEQFSQQSGSDYDFGGQMSQEFGQDIDQQFGQQESTIKIVGIKQEQFDTMHKNFNFQAAKTIQSIAVGVEFHESSSRRYEAIFSWATSKPDTPDGSKLQIFLSKRPFELDPAVTTCLNINSKYPNIPPLASLNDILNIEDLSVEITAEAFQTPNCEPNDPFVSFKGKFEIDRNELTAMLDGPERCQPDANDPTQLTMPSFNNIQLTFNWNEVPPLIQDLSNQAMDISRWGAFFPYITAYHTDVNNEKNKIVYLIQQQGQAYKVQGWYPQMEVILENLDIPRQLLTPGFSWSTIYNQMVTGRDSYPQCILEETKLRTFDGATFSHELANCWSVLARDCYSDQGLILARNAGGEFQARVLWNAAGIMVDITQQMVMVNGEEVLNDASTHLYQVQFSEADQSMIVQFTNYFTVKISDRIIVSMPPTEKGHLCGMCGNMDGEVVGELQGPHNCIFDEGKLFVNSWSVPGDGCNAFSLRSKMKAVNNYRENCPYVNNIETGGILAVGLGHEDDVALEYPETCYNYTYAIRREGDYECSTMQPVNNCQPGCNPLYKKTVPVLYECVSSSSNQQRSQALPSFPKADCRYYAEFMDTVDRSCIISEQLDTEVTEPYVIPS